jgi:hypothetical protein
MNQDLVVDLFEKTAAAEGLDLTQLEDDQLAQAFEYFVSDVLPGIIEDAEGGVDQGGDKIASAMQAVAFREFEKAASAQQIDLNDYSEEEVLNAFAQWLSEDVPAHFQQEEAQAHVEQAAKVAAANLAEIEIMGQHLGEIAAQTFLDKVASEKGTMVHVPGVPGRRSYAKPLAIGAGVLAGTAAAGLGAKKLRDHLKAKKEEKEKEVTASAFDERVAAILHAHCYVG